MALRIELEKEEEAYSFLFDTLGTSALTVLVCSLSTLSVWQPDGVCATCNQLVFGFRLVGCAKVFCLSLLAPLAVRLSKQSSLYLSQQLHETARGWYVRTLRYVLHTILYH